MASVRRKAIGPIFHAGLKSYPRLPIARQLYTGSQKSPLGSEESSLRKTPFIIVDEEIRDAIANKGIGAARPVVALESAIYTHGFPYPDNIALASHLESVVRLNGGIPATIGILNGVARIGLGSEELIQLCSSAGKAETMKVSTRDLSYICGMGIAGRRRTGGTTIAGTMTLAQKAGIDIFATGGLGGVHRGAETSMDISADLIELGRTPITVVSSGCKSFLDIPRTLEVLETQGVTVATFADAREGEVDFPGFWARESGVLSPLTVQNEEEAAAMILARVGLDVKSSILLANPIPPAHAIAKDTIDGIITEAVRDAEVAGVSGHRNTPFVLRRIRELSKGSSVTTNRALIEANVVRATRVAIEYQRLQRQIQDDHTDKDNHKSISPGQSQHLIPPKAKPGVSIPKISSTELSKSRPVDVLVAGSLAIDLCCDYVPTAEPYGSVAPQASTSNPASISQGLGGVGHNVATAIHYLGGSVWLSSAVGGDLAGIAAVQLLREKGIETAGIKNLGSKARTAQYVAINDANKDLTLAMADMSILEESGNDFETLWRPQLTNTKPKWLVLDANWDPPTLQKWIAAGKATDAMVAFEPVSAAKSKRLFSKTSQSAAQLSVIPENKISLATPNALELASIHAEARAAEIFDRMDWWDVINSMGMSNSGSRDKLVSMTSSSLVDQGVPQQSLQLLPFIPTILTKLGSQGVLMTQLLRPLDPRLTSPSSAPYILSRANTENSATGGVYLRLFPSAEIMSKDQIVSVNGAGDTFLGLIVAGLAQDKPKDLTDLIMLAQKGSVMTLKSRESVSPGISALRQDITVRYDVESHRH